MANPEGNHRFSNVVSISDIGTFVASAGHYTYNSGKPYRNCEDLRNKRRNPRYFIRTANYRTNRKLLCEAGTEHGVRRIRSEYQQNRSFYRTRTKNNGEVTIGLPGVYTIRYEAEDTLRKKAVPVFRTVEIVSAIPSFGIKGEPLIYHTKGTVYTDQGVEVFSGYEDGTDFQNGHTSHRTHHCLPIPSGSGFTPTLEGDYTIIWVDQIVDEQLRSGPTRTCARSEFVRGVIAYFEW